MATKITTTTTKPAGVAFYLAATDTRYQDLVSSLPGFVSYNKSYPDENTKVQEIVFATHDDYVNYTDVTTTNDMMIDNRGYNTTNNITFNLELTEI
jgi:hypothetical protein